VTAVDDRDHQAEKQADDAHSGCGRPDTDQGTEQGHGQQGAAKTDGGLERQAGEENERCRECGVGGRHGGCKTERL